MKKIFALVLAVAMLSTTAFAVTDGTNPIVNGASIKPDSSFFIAPSNFVLANGTSSLSIPLGEFVNSNFVVSNRKFSKGANLVKSVTIDDETEMVKVTLNQDINLVAPMAGKANNLVIDKIDIKAKNNTGVIAGANKIGAKRNTTYNYCKAISGVVGLRVGYTENNVSKLSDPKYAMGDLVKFTTGDNSESYGVAVLDAGEFYMEGRVYSGDKIYTSVSYAANKDILKVAEYADAELRFITFTTSGLSANNTVQINAEEDEFIYEIVDKKIVKTNLKWDVENNTWTGKIMGNKAYVISDMELKAIDAPAAGTTNPETGANDVVGIAAALAVISLVAAGAVSLKK